MLTYRTGAAGAPSAAKAMGEHLMQQTLSPEMAGMAEYYGQGMVPPTPAQAAAGRYGADAEGGRLAGDALDAVLAREVDRLDESARDPEGRSVARDELTARALGALVAAELVERDEARAAYRRTGLAETPDTAARINAAVEAAGTSRDHSSTTATPRRDMKPELARRLGIDTSRGLNPAEVANLLNGQRADGAAIIGKQVQAGTEAIGQVFALAEKRMPTRVELEHVLAGRKADGTELPPGTAEAAVRRFQAVLGAKSGELTPEAREAILAGRTATGGALAPEQFHERMDTSRARVGYVDLTFSAPKSVSVAWAFAPTQAERGMIHQAHRDAIDSVMANVEGEIGRARKGKGGKDGYEPGATGWVSFDHYTSRPTVAVIRQDKDGQDYTELHTMKAPTGRIAGDMQLHTHTAVFNAVLTESGRMGGLDLAQLEGRVKEWGALYQAYLATNLRRHGVDMVLDQRTEMARVAAVPESVTEHFSKRTTGGTAAARAYAAQQGLDWDSLDADRKVGLLKQGVQDPRGAKSDDLGDAEAWRRAAAEVKYQHRSVLRPDEKVAEPSREARLEAAYQAALPVLDKQLQTRAAVDGADARVAAVKGLIAAGVASPADINEITRAMRERGVTQGGERTALVWGETSNAQGRQKVGITTTLHESEEKALVAAARAAGRDKSAALSRKQIAAGIAKHPALDFKSEHGRAQRAVMEQLGTGGRLGVAIGVAGSGKTTLLKPLVSAWQEDGRIVHGIALAWRQSTDLTDAGIKAANARAVDPFLKGVEKGRIKLDEKSVVVVDELGLLGTRQLNDLMRAQRTHGFQVVAIGDPKQMQSIEAGWVIELLRRGLGEKAIPELATSVRQVAAEERETVLMFRNGQTEEAVRRKAKNGTLRAIPGAYEEAIAGTVALWQERRAANADRDRYSLSISAPTNHDAHQISLAIREKRRELGEIGTDRRTVEATDGATGAPRTYDLALAEGDKVRLFKRANAVFEDNKQSGNIGQNGTVLTVAGVKDEGLILRTAEGREGLVKWSTLQDQRSGRTMLAYGDVLTTNTSQGATVSEHIFAIPDGSRQVNAFGAYTSGSRHRETSFILTSDGAERAEVTGRRPLGDKRQVREGDVTANIARNFARQPEKEGALALLDKVENVRRGGVRAMQAGKQGLEHREAEGMPRSTLHERFQRSRERTTVKAVTETLREAQPQRNSMMDRLRTVRDDVRTAVRRALDVLRPREKPEDQSEAAAQNQRRGRRR